MSAQVTEVTQCRIFHPTRSWRHEVSTDMVRYLDLGKQPLANALRLTLDRTGEFTAPLAVQACPVCGLSQLTHVVSRETLYRDYLYYSGANPAWHTHCAELANTFAQPGDFVLEIASNDGTLLREFEKCGCMILGVEPATNFLSCGIPTIHDFWSHEIAQRPLIHGRVNLLLATNVLGHVDDVNDFMAGVATALAPNGRAIFEMPYLLDLLRNTAFDTIYHEHLSYWSVTPLLYLLQQHGLVLRDVEHLPDLHGGSMRYTVAKNGEIGLRIWTWMRREHAQTNAETLGEFAGRVKAKIAEIDQQMALCEAGYGAAAKATVLLNLLQNRPPVLYDDSPHKWYRFVPGTDSQVREPSAEAFAKLNALAIMAWNWKEPLMQRAHELGFTGKFFVPLPEPLWLE